MKQIVLLKNDNCRMKPYHIEPVKRYLTRPPANERYKLFGRYRTIDAALAAMVKDAGSRKSHEI